MSLFARALVLISVTVRNSARPLTSSVGVCHRARPSWISSQPICRVETSAYSTHNLYTMPEKKAFERLPKDVVPTNYALKLQPFLEKFTFDGNEEISVEVKIPTKTVQLNSADIDVKTVKYSSEDQNISSGVEISYSTDDETVTFTFPEEIKAGSGTLSLSFTGELNNKMNGFYRSKYTGPDGADRYAAVTQFEMDAMR